MNGNTWRVLLSVPKVVTTPHWPPVTFFPPSSFYTPYSFSKTLSRPLAPRPIPRTASTGWSLGPVQKSLGIRGPIQLTTLALLISQHSPDTAAQNYFAQLQDFLVIHKVLQQIPFHSTIKLLQFPHLYPNDGPRVKEAEWRMSNKGVQGDPDDNHDRYCQVLYLCVSENFVLRYT
ncbi:hypothetical protein RRG08_031113 [Elysia crispata]|uniref:Uncharacterized protein n=1 Tax=Elysia crispata TaxID=231223 RepID=A0AAE0ZG56_9GAST|nr:hypothetical protein RRG08_031113 [Elysia crispata]